MLAVASSRVVVRMETLQMHIGDYLYKVYCWRFRFHGNRSDKLSIVNPAKRSAGN